MREPVAVLRYTESGVDRYGNPAASYAPLDAPLMCGVADSGGSVLETPGSVEVAYDYLLMVEPGIEVLSSDRLVVRGRTCEVVKPHFEWRGLFSSWIPGGTVYVKVTEG